MAFGIKEASVPAASMIAGVSIPLVAERFGWRPLFFPGVLVAPLIWMLIPASEPARGSGGVSRVAGGRLSVRRNDHMLRPHPWSRAENRP